MDKRREKDQEEKEKTSHKVESNKFTLLGIKIIYEL